MKLKTRALCAALTATLIATGACTPQTIASAPNPASLLDNPVRTDKGLVSGVPGAVDGVTVFKGIPFAAPPVGNLRWKMPQPASAWQGVRPGDTFGNVCIQPPGEGRVNPATDFPDSPSMSEDCLYLNVWTPADSGSEKLPVMVWLYGGAYNEGAGSSPFSYGDNLAAKDVVLVTFNYRVGSLGFLSHPELNAESPHNASGNQALGDAVAALQWVKNNIAAFGGDPNNVTIFGESAGAAMDAGLVGSPVADGLFERAISESGGWMGLGIAKMVAREDAEKRTLEAAQKIGATSLAELRALPAKEVFNQIRGQGMIVDGWIIPEDLSKTFAEGRQNKVDVLVGSNAEEGSFTAAFGPPMTLENWTKTAAQRWGDLAELGLAAYPANDDAAAKLVAMEPFSDTLAWHMRLFAESQARVGQDAWLYWFKHRPPYDPGAPDLGAAHTAEIPYVFDNLAAPRTFPGQSSVKLMAGNPREEALADLVSSYWVNFARTGNPNGAGLPEWPRVDALGPTEVMVLDADGRSGRGEWISQPRIDLYKRMYQRDVAGPLSLAGPGGAK
ncbi:carboxylesterase/lipase family protein [Altericroceibacterium xinjiangense]|uniref:carboxylesterase/lipase family protein n=1 Tax=Altericroceibacterium xinjiangense TaxID=762261 RepID=UPI000F7EDE05|nr:carboxylesterase family protein [Altericroceibacterium xinjiangense]